MKLQYTILLCFFLNIKSNISQFEFDELENHINNKTLTNHNKYKYMNKIISNSIDSLYKFNQLNLNQINNPDPLQSLKYSRSISASLGRQKMLKSFDLNQIEQLSDSKGQLSYIKFLTKEDQSMECGESPHIDQSKDIKSLNIPESKIIHLTIQKHKIENRIVAIQFTFQNQHNLKIGSVDNAIMEEIEEQIIEPNTQKIPLLIAKCSTHVNGLQIVQFDDMNQYNYKLGLSKNFNYDHVAKEKLFEIKGLKSIEQTINESNMNIQSIKFIDYSEKEQTCGQIFNNNVTKLSLNSEEVIKSMDIHQNVIENNLHIGKIDFHAEEYITIGDNVSNKKINSKIDAKPKDIILIYASCGDQVHDLSFAWVKHHIMPNIFPNFTYQIKNIGKEGDDNYLAQNELKSSLSISEKLDINSQFYFMNIHDDMYQIKCNNQYITPNITGTMINLSHEPNDLSIFIVKPLTDKTQKIEVAEELGNNRKQLSQSPDSDIIDIWTKFGILQTWEVDQVNMKLENQEFDIEHAEVVNNIEKIFPESFTNEANIKVFKDFEQDREIEDSYTMMPSGNFKLGKDVLIDTQELSIKDNKAVFNKEKPFQIIFGKNSKKTPIKLQKSVEVMPKREVAANVEVTKYKINVKYSATLVDKITSNKLIMGAKLTASIYRNPQIAIDKISEEINCYQRGQKKTLPNGDAFCSCETGFKGRLCEIPICDKECNHGECLVTVSELNIRQMTCKCPEEQMGEDCAIPTDLVRQEHNFICKGHQCFCKEGFYGENCDAALNPPECNGHGSSMLGKCHCDEGWSGEKCDCNITCQNGGKCVKNTCQCPDGWGSSMCERTVEDLISEKTNKLCMNNCNGNGKCEDGMCLCLTGFNGLDCSCEQSCVNGGICIEGKCNCPLGFYGAHCEFLGCKLNCSGQGKCVEGRCECDEGFTGEVCDKLLCEHNCSGHGKCIPSKGKPICKCELGWGGDKCEISECSKECRENGGICKGKSCLCPPERTGDECRITQCKNGCNNHGQCTEANQCLCLDIYQGDDCSERICKNNCNGNGQCNKNNQTCICNPGFFEEDCSTKKCPNDCNRKGECNQDDGLLNPKCVCDIGQMGQDCSKRQCNNDCNGHGNCINGICYCDQFFQGIDCSEHSCPYNCNHRGVCEDKGKCVCSQGYMGEQCQSRTCLNNCNGRGTCVNGECHCDIEYTGEDCKFRNCKNSCSGQGSCEYDNGIPVCNCLPGFTGDDCSVKLCLNQCSGHGICTDGICTCNEHWTGTDCSTTMCTEDCHHRGECGEQNTCICDPPAQGKFCEKTRCSLPCVHGTCDNTTGVCTCADGYTGEDCGKKECPVPDCQKAGICDEDQGKCICDKDHSGENCEVVQCVECDGYCLHDTNAFMGQSGSCIKNGCDLDCDHGTCKVDATTGKNQCDCIDGFEGLLCTRKICDRLCKNGTCIEDKCHCSDNYTGEQCDEQQIELSNIVVQTVEDQIDECEKKGIHFGKNTKDVQRFAKALDKQNPNDSVRFNLKSMSSKSIDRMKAKNKVNRSLGKADKQGCSKLKSMIERISKKFDKIKKIDLENKNKIGIKKRNTIKQKLINIRDKMNKNIKNKKQMKNKNSINDKIYKNINENNIIKINVKNDFEKSKDVKVDTKINSKNTHVILDSNKKINKNEKINEYNDKIK